MSEQNQEIDTPEMSRESVKENILPEAPAVIMDDERFDEEEREREDAFSAEPEWKGEALQPFAYSRKALFYTQRLAMGTPPLEEVLGDGSAFLGDALRILFLCAHDPARYRQLRHKPLLLQERIDAWGDEQIKSDADALNAVNTALRIFTGSEVNQAEAVPGKDSGDELGN